MKSVACIAILYFVCLSGYAQTHPLVEKYLAERAAASADPYAGVPYFDSENHMRGVDFEQRDSSNLYLWDAGSQAYQFTTHAAYHYTPNTVVRLVYNNLYELSYRDSTIYDDGGRELVYYLSIWTGSDWWDFLHFSYTYDDDGHLLEFVHREDNGGGLKNLSRTVYSYNAEGLPEERLDHDWLSGFKDWGNDRRHTFTYDDNNLLTTTILERWINDAYQLSSRTTNTYGLQQELLNTQSEWRRNDTWELSGQVLFVYNETLQLIEQENQAFDSVSWIPETKVLFTYDKDGNQSAIAFQLYDSLAWINDYRTLFAHNESNSTISEVYQEWDTTWASVDSIYHYYSTISSVNTRPFVEEFTLYPNPCIDVLHINETDQHWNAVEIVDMHTGRIIRKSIDQKTVHVEGIASGVYLLQLHHDDRVVGQQRFVKL